MWSYEIVFEHPVSCFKKKKQKGIQMSRTTEVIASETDFLILDYVKKRLQEFKDYELIAIIKRHPIVHTLKQKA